MASQRFIFKKDNYEIRRNTTDEKLSYLMDTIGVGGSGIIIVDEVVTYNDLPAASAHTGEYWAVQTTTGLIGFRKFAGLYRSDGSNWVYMGNPIAAATDIYNTPKDTITSTNVQDAIDELEDDIQNHIGSGGTNHSDATTIQSGFMSAADKTKLNGIATGATANATDAALRDRSTHTGTQTVSTLSDYNTVTDTKITDAFSAHTALADPHPGYLTTAEGNAAYQPLDSDLTSIAGLTTTAYGRGFLTLADNAALTTRVNTFTSSLGGAAPASGGGTTNFLRADGTWTAPTASAAWGSITGTLSSQTDLNTALNGKQPLATVLTNTTASFTTALETKLNGIATGATANDTDANLKNRANHTGTQPASTISDFSEAVDDRVGALLVAGTNVTLNYDDTANTLTINSSGGGGGGSPGGSTTQIQYNNAGSFAGAANLTWDNTNSILDLNGTLELTALGAEPAVPASGNGRLYTRDIAGKIFPKFAGPSGVGYPLQANIGFNNIRKWSGGATTTATTFASTVGTMPYTGASPTAPTIPALSTTNLLTQTQRSTISTGATAGGLAYIRGNQQIIWRGNAAGRGGFLVIHRFALSGTLQAGLRCFAGIVDVAANPTNIDPTTTTTPGGVGLAINTNSGNWNIVNNITGTARTSTTLGASFPVNNTDLMEIILFCPPNGSAISYRVTNWSTGAQTSGTLSTNIPANTTFMAPSVWITNNATAAAQTLDFVSTYVETDY